MLMWSLSVPRLTFFTTSSDQSHSLYRCRSHPSCPSPDTLQQLQLKDACQSEVLKNLQLYYSLLKFIKALNKNKTDCYLCRQKLQLLEAQAFSIYIRQQVISSVKPKLSLFSNTIMSQCSQQHYQVQCLELSVLNPFQGRNRQVGVKSGTIVPSEARNVFRVWDSSCESCHNKVPQSVQGFGRRSVTTCM